MKRYYISEGHVARLTDTGEDYRNAEILRDGVWEPTKPANLVWKAQPLTEEEGLKLIARETGEAIIEG